MLVSGRQIRGRNHSRYRSKGPPSLNDGHSSNRRCLCKAFVLETTTHLPSMLCRYRVSPWPCCLGLAAVRPGAPAQCNPSASLLAAFYLPSKFGPCFTTPALLQEPLNRFAFGFLAPTGCIRRDTAHRALGRFARSVRPLELLPGYPAAFVENEFMHPAHYHSQGACATARLGWILICAQERHMRRR